MRQNRICELYGKIGHKADSCIIHGPKFLPTSLGIKINHFNALNSEEQNNPPRYWNSQPPEAHFKYRTSSLKTSPVVSAIMGRLNHNTIDNGDVKVHPSYFPV